MDRDFAMKACTRCGQTDLSQFSRSSRDGYKSRCKACIRVYSIEHREEIAAYAMAYRNRNHEKITTNRVLYRTEEHKKEKRVYDKIYHASARDRRCALMRAYGVEHKVELQAYRNGYKIIRRKTDSTYRMKACLSARTLYAFKAQGLKKSGHTLDWLGCNSIELQTWLTSKFVDDMTLENHGIVWDIDHVIPCSAWDLSKPDHVKACFHWTNLQPLESRKNRYEKGGLIGTRLGTFTSPSPSA